MSHRSDAVTEVSKNIVQLGKNRNFVLCVHNSSYIQEKTITHLFIYLNVKLNLIWHLLALLGAHPFLHVSRVRAKLVDFSII